MLLKVQLRFKRTWKQTFNRNIVTSCFLDNLQQNAGKYSVSSFKLMTNGPNGRLPMDHIGGTGIRWVFLKLLIDKGKRNKDFKVFAVRSSIFVAKQI